MAESYRYDAFGNETIYDTNGTPCKTSLIQNPWRFSSKRRDEETGLVYFGRRYYDPKVGNWLTMDPLGLKAGPNLYAYVLNNPMTHFDLYGLLDEEVREGANSYHMSQGFIKENLDERQAFCDHVKETTKQREEFKKFRESIQLPSESLNSPWTNLKEAIPGFFEDAFEAMDKYSYAAMLAPHPYVKAGGVGLKALGATGKALLKMLRRSSKTVVNHIVHENFLTKQVASTTNALVRKEFNITSGFVNLASEARTNHIILGEKPGYGGHLWPGQPGKTPFPQSWGPDKIMHYVSDIATDPGIQWEQTSGRIGATITNKGNPVRFNAIGERENVKIKVVIEPAGNGIITAHPCP